MSFDYDSDVFDELLDQLNDAKMLEIDCPECNHPIEVSLVISEILSSVLNVALRSN